LFGLRQRNVSFLVLLKDSPESQRVLRNGDGAVGAGVLVQERHPREGLVAHLAGVLLDVHVGLLMGSQVRAVGKGSWAVGALEGLLAGVGADVSLEQPGSREGLAADRALAGQRMGADVHLEGSNGGVQLATLLAGVRLLLLVTLGCGAVELAVLGQTHRGGVHLLALVALEAIVLGMIGGHTAGRGGATHGGSGVG